MTSERKVLLIGLDGATFDLIEPWVAQGRLPTLARLFRKGARATLWSSPLSNSAQAWSTLISGKNAASHGIYDFFERKPGSYDVRFVNASFRRGRSLWRVLSEAGKRVGVINVPMSYPAEDVSGPVLCGLDSPGMDGRFAHPPGLLDEIKREVGQYILEPGIWGLIRKGQYGEALEAMLETINVRTATARYLMGRYPWDFFMVVFTCSDKVQHHFWKFMDPARTDIAPEVRERYREAIFKVYERLDRSVAELAGLVGPETALYVVSDHGAGPSTNRTFYINRWLRSEGLLAAGGSGSLRARGRQAVASIIRRLDRAVKKELPRGVKEALLRAMPGLRGKVESIISLGRIEWGATQAYSYENHPAIFLNVAGREPMGTVRPGAEYEALRERIMGLLLGLRCPETGEAIVERAVRREEVYSGPLLDAAPDIIFEWKDSRYIHRPSDLAHDGPFIEILRPEQLAESEQFSRPSGVHRSNGILICRGEGLAGGGLAHGAQARLQDMAPTLLCHLGVAIPADMDGRVLDYLFTEAFRKANPPRYEAPSGDDAAGQRVVFGEEEAREIGERLKGLGYID
jgi:predicted AlkP superfamily phosphohydrolase/phosphomutase